MVVAADESDKGDAMKNKKIEVKLIVDNRKRYSVCSKCGKDCTGRFRGYVRTGSHVGENASECCGVWMQEIIMGRYGYEGR